MKTLAFRNGDLMPILGLGTWKSQPGEVYAAVREGIRIGYRHIDCAPVYGNEVEIGNAIRDACREGEVTRKELWMTSKLWGDAHGRENVQGALKKTLQDLRLEWLDLYQIHWPIPLKAGVAFPSSPADFAQTPLESTWAGMEAAVSAGLTRHIGLSNFSIKKISALLPRCKIKPEVDQIELHPFLQQPELVSYCAAQGILVTAYAPLGSSDRPAVFKSASEPSLLENPVIGSIAEMRGCTPAQVLLAWHVQRGISVVPKSIASSRLRENFDAAEIQLTAADLERIAGLDRQFRYISGRVPWLMEGSPWTLQTIWDGL
jgi:alcohol dehydrogenase (NADP+)